MSDDSRSVIDVLAVFDVLAVAATAWAAWAGGAALLRPLRAFSGGATEPKAASAAEPDDRGRAFVEEIVCGFLLLHVALQGLDLLAVPWHRPLLAGLFALAGLAWWSTRRAARDHRSAAPRPPRARFGPADAASAIAVTSFALACWFLRSPFSDFVYHWGLKAERSFLGRGTDYELLARPANAYLHPDYPNLFPELLAAPAILSGRFHEPALLLLSALFLGLLALVLRDELRRTLHGRAMRELALAALVLGIAAFCIGYYQAGSADLPFALAVLLGASALAEPRPAAAALRAGLAAALAAGLKIEGPPFAAILLLLLAVRHGRAMLRRPALLGLAATPVVLVVAPWVYQLGRHDLYQPTNSAGLGAIDAQRIATIAEHAWRVLLLPEWHGLPLLLFALPLLLLRASTRPVAVLCTLQLGFYLYVYASAPLEPGYFVLSSLPRLLLHLLPAVGLASFAALGAPLPVEQGAAAEGVASR